MFSCFFACQGILVLSWTLWMVHCQVSGFCYVPLKKIDLDFNLKLTWLNSPWKLCLHCGEWQLKFRFNSFSSAGFFVSVPCMCSSEVNQRCDVGRVYAQNLGSPSPFLDLPPPLSSDCGCPELCPLVHQANNIASFYTRILVPLRAQTESCLQSKF